jgi:uncharacterized DUF497 family protein
MRATEAGNPLDIPETNIRPPRGVSVKLRFEWREEKAIRNRKDHRVSFDEAASVFDDPLLITFPDPNHSETEERYLSIGISSKGRILIVSHTDREDKTRIISARKATVLERSLYEEK